MHIPCGRRCPWQHAAVRPLEYRTRIRIAPGCRGRCKPEGRELVAPERDELVGSWGTRILDAAPPGLPHHIYSEKHITMLSIYDCWDGSVQADNAIQLQKTILFSVFCI
jgi:hypothetical protein